MDDPPLPGPAPSLPPDPAGPRAADDPADARLREVLGALAALAVQLDAAGALTWANDPFLEATGWARAEALGAAWDEAFAPPESVTRALAAGALAGRAGRGTGELLTRDGDRRLVAWDAVPLRAPDGGSAGVACVGRDVTDERRSARERVRLARELSALVDRDVLTGLPNHRGLLEGTEHATRVAARMRRADAVVAVRVDGLRAAYAAYGGAEADDAVCAVAEALRAAVRDSDVVARVADDTFVVYAVGTAAPDHATATARRVRAAIERQNARARAAGRAFDLACAVGAAERAPGEALDELLARAAAVDEPAPARDGPGAAE
jgi:diguanylate cyclase (GGDEF)-like protein/PAS domain S-box-containing protein